jgi:hypothetical protein
MDYFGQQCQILRIVLWKPCRLNQSTQNGKYYEVLTSAINCYVLYMFPETEMPALGSCKSGFRVSPNIGHIFPVTQNLWLLFLNSLKEVRLGPETACCLQTRHCEREIKRSSQYELKTERRGRMVYTAASYSGGPGFKSRLGDRIF